MKTNCNIKLFIIVFSLCNCVLLSKDTDVQDLTTAIKNAQLTFRLTGETPSDSALIKHVVSIEPFSIEPITIANGSIAFTFLAGIITTLHNNEYESMSNACPLLLTTVISLSMHMLKKYYLNTEPNNEDNMKSKS